MTTPRPGRLRSPRPAQQSRHRCPRPEPQMGRAWRGVRRGLARAGLRLINTRAGKCPLPPPIQPQVPCAPVLSMPEYPSITQRFLRAPRGLHLTVPQEPNLCRNSASQLPWGSGKSMGTPSWRLSRGGGAEGQEARETFWKGGAERQKAQQKKSESEGILKRFMGMRGRRKKGDFPAQSPEHGTCKSS